MKKIVTQNLLLTRKAVFAFFLTAVLFTNSGLFAQKSSPVKPNVSTEISPLEAKFQEEVGTMAQDFWSPKLNIYKNRIDKVLSSNDLSELNKLRARWGVLIGNLASKAEKSTNQKNASKNKSEEINFEGDDFGELMEVFTIFSSAQEMAKKYRTELDKVGETVITDVGGFVENVATSMENFGTRNASMLRNDKTYMARTTEISEGAKDLREVANSLKNTETRNDFMQVYNIAFEPIIMLFSGSDLREIFSSLGERAVFAKPIAGIAIPEGAVLRQNYPNPATNQTNIKYRLQDNSPTVALKIYNSNGTEVMTLEEGSREKGEHEIKVDVSALPSGSYLYQLKISTPEGEQVFAKTMQVVK